MKRNGQRRVGVGGWGGTRKCLIQRQRGRVGVEEKVSALSGGQEEASLFSEKP